VRLIFNVKIGDGLVGILLEGAPSTTIRSNDGREAKVTDNSMTVLCQKNIFGLQVPVKDVMGVEILDGRQYLFDVEECDIHGEATGIVDFVPEVPRVYRLMNDARK